MGFEAGNAAESAPLLADLARLERTEAEEPQALPSEEVHLAQMGGDFPVLSGVLLSALILLVAYLALP